MMAGKIIFKPNMINDAQRTAVGLQPMSEKKYTLLPSRIPIPVGVMGRTYMARYAASNAINPSILKTFILNIISVN